MKQRINFLQNGQELAINGDLHQDSSLEIRRFSKELCKSTITSQSPHNHQHEAESHGNQLSVNEHFENLCGVKFG